MTPLGDAGTRLSWLSPIGERTEAKIEVASDWAPVNHLLRSRTIELDVEPGPLRLVALAADLDEAARQRAYELLDNEILAGLRLARLALGTGRPYPGQVSRLVGYEPFEAEQFALLEAYRGSPVETVAGHLLIEERPVFMTELITGLRWAAAAGLAHRGLSPATVLWSDRRLQITDFCSASLIGVPRAVVGRAPWAAPEQRSDVRPVTGDVSDRDDVWAAAKLICFVITGTPVRREELESLNLRELLDDAFGPPEHRPSAAALLKRLRVVDPFPRPLVADHRLEEGRLAFAAARPSSASPIVVDVREPLLSPAPPEIKGPQHARPPKSKPKPNWWRSDKS
jgi:serine/threonine protein kinase